MGRAKDKGSARSGFTIRSRPGRETKTVVFWDPRVKRQVEKSTGETDPKRAKARAVQIVARALAGAPPSDGGRSCLAEHSTERLSTEWVKSLKGSLDDKTLAAYLMAFESHLNAAFPSVHDVTTTTWRDYIRDRLAVVQAQTVRKELSPMRGLLSWCVEEKRILSELPNLPGIPKRATGTEFAKRRRSKPDEISPDEARAIIDALPVWSTEVGPVQSRFRLQYSEGLRSTTLDKLRKPDHWREGSNWLDLPASTLKGRVAKRKRLSDEGKAALKEACAGLTEGLIFGSHDYREQISAAAKSVFDDSDDRLKRFTATHLRSAAITHFLDRGAPLTAAQAFADHKLATTTDRYVRASQRALEAELKRQGRVQK